MKISVYVEEKKACPDCGKRCYKPVECSFFVALYECTKCGKRGLERTRIVSKRNKQSRTDYLLGYKS